MGLGFRFVGFREGVGGGLGANAYSFGAAHGSCFEYMFPSWPDGFRV